MALSDFKFAYYMNDSINPVAETILDGDTQELIKAGYLHSNLALTDLGKLKLFAFLFSEHKDKLVEEAKVWNLKNETRN